MNIRNLLLLIATSIGLQAQPLRQFGEILPEFSSPIMEVFLVRYSDVKNGAPPFRISTKFIEGPGARVGFEIEIDHGLDELLQITLSSGKRTEPELMTPLAFFTDSRGVHRASFEVNPNYQGELWLIFSMNSKNPNEKSTMYFLDLKSWPMTFINRSGQKTETKWFNKTIETTPEAATPADSQ